jgi:hypothetical protein
MAVKFEDIDTIGTVAKNKRETIQVKLVSVNDRPCLDFRIFFTTADSDDLKPSGKGLCLTAECMTELLPLLEKGLADLKNLKTPE